jgi:hypothetical protein
MLFYAGTAFFAIRFEAGKSLCAYADAIAELKVRYGGSGAHDMADYFVADTDGVEGWGPA